MPNVTNLLAAQTITASGNSATQTIAANDELHVTVRVEKLAGTTPTIDFSVQWSTDGTTWTTLVADVLPQAGAMALKKMSDTFPAKATKWRLKWVVAGASASFKVSAGAYASTPESIDGDPEGKAYADQKIAALSAVYARLGTTRDTVLRNEYINPSAEGAATLVTDLNAVASISTDSFPGWPLSGTKSHKAANSGSGGFRVKTAASNRASAAASEAWTVSATIYNPQASSRQFSATLNPLTAAGASLGAIEGSSATAPAGGTCVVTVTITAPATTGLIEFWLGGKSAGGATTGDAFYIDQIDLYQGSGARTYFDGSSSGATWEGAANASRSLKTTRGTLYVNEGPLSFLDPRVGGVIDAASSSTVDNAAALNAAYALLNSSGGELFVPRGVYPFRTAPNAQPGGVWLRGEGFDYSTTSDGSRPVRGSVFRAMLPMTHLLRLGSGVALGPGSTAASVDKMVLDGNNKADSTLWVNGSRNRVINTQVYSGLLRGVLLAGQNVEIKDSVVAQDNVGDCITVTGSNVMDNKIWQSQIRSPGATGACVRILDAVATDIQLCHLWAGGGGVPANAEALISIVGTTSGGVINTLITDNTIEGVIGPEIMFDASAGPGVITCTTIAGNKFYMNTNAQDKLYPVLYYKRGTIGSTNFTGNTIAGDGPSNRYKSIFDLDAAVIDTGGTVVAGNVGKFVGAMQTGIAPPSPFEYAANQIHDGSGWSRYTSAGLGFPFTVDPGLVRSGDSLSVGSANQAIYARVLHGGTVSKIGLQVTATSGNVSVAVYRNAGVGRGAVPGAQLATSGSVACPAVGYAEIALGSSVTLSPGDWIAVSADNATAAFQSLLSTAGDSGLGLGRQYRQATAHPLPATPSSLVATRGQTHCLIGVQ